MRFRNYNKCIEYLFGLERVGIKYDLKNIKKILGFISHPEKKFISIHIAGTNGKGTVASILNSVLAESGFKSGLYTSPHILDFRERILVNGEMISEKFILDFTNRLYNLFEEIKPSFFEATTAMAFEYFASNNVEYAVIEAGLGGRLDSTNVLNPLLSVITGISIDHTEYLGNTIESIAKEKAGIIKKNFPLVTGKMDSVSEKIIEKRCSEKNSEYFHSEKYWDVKIVKGNEEYMKLEVSEKRDYKNKIEIHFPVVGKYQVYNIKTALTSIDIIGKLSGISFTEKNISDGFKNVIKNSRFYGRFQKISGKPKVVVDVSHNVQGIKNLKENLKFIKYRKLYIIFGMMKDKEYIKCLAELEKLNATIVLTKPDYKRAEEPEILFAASKRKEKFFIAENVATAFKNVKKISKQNDLILITGSFFLVSDFLKMNRFHL